jgi:hypothetical protein
MLAYCDQNGARRRSAQRKSLQYWAFDKGRANAGMCGGLTGVIIWTSIRLVQSGP